MFSAKCFLWIEPDQISANELSLHTSSYSKHELGTFLCEITVTRKYAEYYTEGKTHGYISEHNSCPRLTET